METTMQWKLCIYLCAQGLTSSPVISLDGESDHSHRALENDTVVTAPDKQDDILNASSSTFRNMIAAKTPEKDPNTTEILVRSPTSSNGTENVRNNLAEHAELESLNLKADFTGKDGPNVFTRFGNSNIERSKRDLSGCPVAIKSLSTCPWTYTDEGREVICLSRTPTSCKEIGADLCLLECKQFFINDVAVACIASRPCTIDAQTGVV